MSLNNTPRSADRTAARLDRSSDAFPWRIATAMLAGYLLATVPQVILDPQLKSHVTYVKRYYPFAYLIIPIAIIVFTATVIIARFGRRQSRLVTAIPFIAGCALSAPIFRPEVPHGNLVFVGVVWALLGVFTVWIHGFPITNPSVQRKAVPWQVRVEYIKEQIAFWKGLGYGLVAAYLGTVIPLVQSLHAANAEFVSSRPDLLLLDRYPNVEVSVMSVFLFAGPLYELATKVLVTSEYLLEVTEAA